MYFQREARGPKWCMRHCLPKFYFNNTDTLGAMLWGQTPFRIWIEATLLFLAPHGQALIISGQRTVPRANAAHISPKVSESRELP